MTSPIMELRFRGTLDPFTLTRLQKLLNLESYGCLGDTQSFAFGRRSLDATGALDPSVELLREADDEWRVAIFARDRADAGIVEQTCREALAAARATGLVLMEPHAPATAEPEAEAEADNGIVLPTRSALTVRLRPSLPLSTMTGDGFSTITSALRLRSEVGSGGEAGWRYLRREPDAVSLLQAYADDTGIHTVSLLVDHEDTDPAALDGVLLQILAAARLADAPVRDIEPHPGRVTWDHQRVQEIAWSPALAALPVRDPSAEQLLALGDEASQSLDGLLEKFGAIDAPWELKRGLVLTAVAGLVHHANLNPISGMYALLPRDGVLHEHLRAQILDLLLGREPRPPLVPPPFGPTHHRPPYYPG